jgi:hypothetical protein
VAGTVANLRPAQPGNGLALRHSAHSTLRLAPRAAELAEELREVVPARSEADESAVRLLAMILARIEAAHDWLAEHGLLQAKGEPQPVLRALSTWENTAARLLDRLGLTAAGRAGIGLEIAKGEAVRLTLTRLAEMAEADE